MMLCIIAAKKRPVSSALHDAMTDSCPCAGIFVILSHIVTCFQRTEIMPMETALLLVRIRKIVSDTRNVMIYMPVSSVVLPLHFWCKLGSKEELELLDRAAEQFDGFCVLLIV